MTLSFELFPFTGIALWLSLVGLLVALLVFLVKYSDRTQYDTGEAS